MEFEYETQGAATFLIYQKREQDIIDSMSMGMISNNRIEGIIPFVYVQNDDEVYFKYNISAKNTLEQYFSGVVNKKRFLGVLESLIDTFILSEEYMLEPSSFVLDASFVFVNPATTEAFLIVIPIVREAEITIENFIKNFVFGIQFDQTEDCSYIAALISFLNSNQFSLLDFRKLVKDLQLGKNTGSEVPKRMSPHSPIQNIQPVKKKEQNPSNNYDAVANANANVNSMDRVEVDIPKIPEEKPETTKKKGFFTKRKEQKEEKKAQKKPLFGGKTKTKEKKKKESTGTFGSMAIPGMEKKVSEEPEKAKEPVSIPVHPTQLEKQKIVPQDFGETLMMEDSANEDETIMDNSFGIENQTINTYYLVLKDSYNPNIMYKVPIKDEIHIGRLNTDIIIEDPKVSREHCAVILRGEQLYIKDLHSKNKTYYENVPIYEETPIFNRGQIRIGDHSYSVELMKG